MVSPDENSRRTQALRAVIATSPDAGANTLIVTHKPNIVDALGEDWFEVREGEASIFKDEGGGKYALVARVQVGQWGDGQEIEAREAPMARPGCRRGIPAGARNAAVEYSCCRATHERTSTTSLQEEA